MLGFIFDNSTSLSILLDIIQSTTEQFEVLYREEALEKRQHDVLVDQYKGIKTIIEAEMGALGGSESD